MPGILPKPIRKMLAVFRGQVSPVFVFLSVMLGFWFGLTPGWSGIHTVIVIVVLILNIHLGLFLLSAGIGKALCFAGAPVLFHIGTWIHANLPVLLRALASLPLIGMTDFDRYSVAGALVVGPIVGAIAGLSMAGSVIGFRRGLLKFEEGSERFRKWYSHRWVRIMDRLLVGKRTKNAKALFEAKTKVFRLAGVIVALLVVGGLVLATTLVKDDAAKDYVATKMTQVNKAEVNLNELLLKPLAGAVSAAGIEVTDPEKPEQNQVAIGNIAADIGVYDLLLGKLVMEEVQVTDVQFGQPREVPGKVIEASSEPKAPVFDPCDFKIEDIDINKLETYFKNAQAVKDWLGKISKWLPEPKEEEGETEAEEIPLEYLGFLTARTETPMSPRLLAKKIQLDEVQIPSEFFGSSKISIENISDSAKVAALPVRLAIESHDTPAKASITFDYTSADKGPLVTGTFDGFDLGKMQDSISSKAGLAFAKGMASGKFDGVVTSEMVDLTADVAISGIEAAAQGDKVWGLDAETATEAINAMENLEIKMRIVGPVTEPRIAFDIEDLQAKLKEALVKAGKARLAEEIDKQVGEQVEKALGDEASGPIREVLKKPGELLKGLGGLLGGNKKEEEK